MPSKRVARSIPRTDLDERDIDADGDEETPPPAARSAAKRSNGDDEETKPRRGWSAGEETQQSTSNFAQSFRLTEQQQVVKFLEDDPYVNYTRHWIERSTPTGRQSRSYTCLKTFKQVCPLCEAGDKPQAVSSFNIAVIGDDGVPMLKSWDCGPKLFGILKGHAGDPKVAPLTKGYFLASRTGKMGTVNYQVIPIKPRSLEEDYEIEPPTQAELDRLDKWDRDVVSRPKTKDLEAVAAEIADEY